VSPHDGIVDRRHLETTDYSTAYVVELSGIEMAAFRLVNQQQDNNRPTKNVVFLNCQAAIPAVQYSK
jgi:hypothetical protein